MPFEKQQTISDQLFQLIDNLNDSIIIIDLNGEVLYWNKGAENIFAIPREEMIGKKVEEKNPDFKIEKIAERLQEGEVSELRLDWKLERSDGKVIWLDVLLTPMFDEYNNVIAIAGVSKDITDRKKNELLLNRLNEDFHLAVDTAELGIWEMDPETNKIIWNDVLLDIYGISREQFELDYDYWTTLVFPEDYEMALQAMEKVFQGEEVFNIEFRIKRPDGEVRWINGSARPINDEKGRLIKVIGINRDYTAIKSHQISLSEKNAQLKQVNEEMDYFVYSTSHNLRSPLSSTLGIVNLLRHDIDNETKLAYLDLIEKSIVRLDETIREITDYFQNTRSPIGAGQVDIEDIIETIEKDLEMTSFGEKNVLKKKINLGKQISGDPIRLRIILLNLISNAFKYSKKSERICHFECTVKNNKLQFIIEDEGIGIPKEELQNIFKMFYRASNYSTGSGLGLYIVKHSVEKLKGKIKVESELGKGSTFTVEIPIKSV
ncbi:MAG: PAS domain S-box protein [Cytophagales bacterium]